MTVWRRGLLLGLASALPGCGGGRASDDALPVIGGAGPLPAAGEAQLPRLEALAGAHGTAHGLPDAALRWTALRPGVASLTLVIHFHGFPYVEANPAPLPQDGLPGSGLDLPDDGRTAVVALVPRGRRLPPWGRIQPFDWPVLASAEGQRALLAEVMARLREASGLALPDPARLVLTAHSGGGAALMAATEASLARGPRVDAAFLYDALYRPPEPLLRWAEARMMQAGAPPGALCAIVRPGTATEANGRRLAARLASLLARAPAGASARWRVLATHTGHNDIPPAYGAKLLADPGAELPGTWPPG
jgi:hypothetical protein